MPEGRQQKSFSKRLLGLGNTAYMVVINRQRENIGKINHINNYIKFKGLPIFKTLNDKQVTNTLYFTNISIGNSMVSSSIWI